MLTGEDKAKIVELKGKISTVTGLGCGICTFSGMYAIKSKEDAELLRVAAHRAGTYGKYVLANLSGATSWDENPRDGKTPFYAGNDPTKVEFFKQAGWTVLSDEIPAAHDSNATCTLLGATTLTEGELLKLRKGEGKAAKR